MVAQKGIREISHSALNGFGSGGQIISKRWGRRKTLVFVGHMRGMAFSIVDASDPSRPEVLFQQDQYEGTITHKLRILKGRYLVLNCEKIRELDLKKFDSGFRIFDLKDVSKPKEISFTRVQGPGVHRFWIDEEREMGYMPALVDGFDGRILLIYDLSDIKSPKLVSRWWYPGQHLKGGEHGEWLDRGLSYRAHGPPIRVNDRMYLGYWDAGALIFDARDPRRIELISQRTVCPPYGGSTHTVLPVTREIRGRKWIIVTHEPLKDGLAESEMKPLWIMDATDEKNIVPVSTHFVRDKHVVFKNARFGPHNLREDDLTLKNDEVIVSWYSAGVRILDISDPYRPSETAWFVPKPVSKQQRAIQTNDFCVDDRGLIYTIDRFAGGMHILERKS